MQATLFGALGGVLVVFSIVTLDKMKIDDLRNLDRGDCDVPESQKISQKPKEAKTEDEFFSVEDTSALLEPGKKRFFSIIK